MRLTFRRMKVLNEEFHSRPIRFDPNSSRRSPVNNIPRNGSPAGSRQPNPQNRQERSGSGRTRPIGRALFVGNRCSARSIRSRTGCRINKTASSVLRSRVSAAVGTAVCGSPYDDEVSSLGSRFPIRKWPRSWRHEAIECFHHERKS